MVTPPTLKAAKPFISDEFQAFLSQNGIIHQRISPYHPASNGLAEWTAQTLKRAMKKLTGYLETWLSRFLFNYRITPQRTTGVSPTKLMFSRRVRFDLLTYELRLTDRRIVHRHIDHIISRASNVDALFDNLDDLDFSTSIPWSEQPSPSPNEKQLCPQIRRSTHIRKPPDRYEPSW